MQLFKTFNSWLWIFQRRKHLWWGLLFSKVASVGFQLYSKEFCLNCILNSVKLWSNCMRILSILLLQVRTNHRRCSIKKLFFNIWQYSQENTCVGVYFFWVLLQACNCIKKRLQPRCFPVNIAKFARAPILKNIYEQLLLTCVI